MARSDLINAIRWYQERNRSTADSFRTSIKRVIENLATTSMHAAADVDGVRRRVLKDFPFTVFYVLEEHAIIVIAIAHHRREPGYWK